MMRRRSLWPLVVLALFPAACARDAQKSELQTGSSHILLTDAPFPFDLVSRVDIYIVSVAVSYGADTAAGTGEWITVATPRRTFDMLALGNGATTELGSIDLPTGLIQAVRMVIDTDKSSLTLKDGHVLTGANGGVLGWGVGLGELNALIHENVLAVPDTGAVIVIDYDLSLAFGDPQVTDSVPGGLRFGFMRQFRAVDAARTGTVIGEVRAGSAAGPPVRDVAVRLYREDWHMHLARTDSAGAFRIPYVTRSSFWTLYPAPYSVGIEWACPVGWCSSRSAEFDVEAGQTVDVGVLVMP